MFTIGKTRSQEALDTQRRRADRAEKERGDAVAEEKALKARLREQRLARAEQEKANNG